MVWVHAIVWLLAFLFGGWTCAVAAISSGLLVGSAVTFLLLVLAFTTNAYVVLVAAILIFAGVMVKVSVT